VVQEKGRAMIGAIIPFLITPLGRWAAIGAMILAAWIGLRRIIESKVQSALRLG
jgi:hypothetical protein